jgi:anti-sigma regulatory factor (Ser/Thr protein kinase)
MIGTTTLQLPRRPGCAGIARMIVTAHGNALGPEGLKNARLMVSEIVTNAFEHGQGQICLTVDSSDDGLRAQVDDEGAITGTESRGYGLRFVQKLADDWGLESARARVWFHVAA